MCVSLVPSSAEGGATHRCVQNRLPQMKGTDASAASGTGWGPSSTPVLVTSISSSCSQVLWKLLCTSKSPVRNTRRNSQVLGENRAWIKWCELGPTWKHWSSVWDFHALFPFYTLIHLSFFLIKNNGFFLQIFWFSQHSIFRYPLEYYCKQMAQLEKHTYNV